MRTDGRKRTQGRVISLPEGTVTVLNDEAPVMVLVKQSWLVERGDSGFWSPKWESVYGTLNRCPFKVHPLGDFITDITYGHVGHREYPPAGTKLQSRGGQITWRLPDGQAVRGVAYYQVRNLRRTGLDIFESVPSKRYIAEGSHNDKFRSRVQAGDILLVRSGE